MSDLTQMRLGEFLDAIAAKTPAPGGGAVASATGALAAALAGMVVSYSLGKKDLAAHQDALRALDAELRAARALFMTLADEDQAAYGLVNELMKLPADHERRRAQWAVAVEASVRVPMATIAACINILRAMERLEPISNRRLISDLGIAAELAGSAARASVWNLRVNLPLIQDEALRRVRAHEGDRAAQDAGERSARVQSACGR